MTRIVLVVAWLGVAGAAGWLSLAPSATQVPPPPQAPSEATAPPAQAATPPSGYAGSDTCVTCHTDQEASLKGTKHGQTANPRSPAAKLGCESCHGPGQAHVDDDAKGQDPEVQGAEAGRGQPTCLTCHNRGTHAGWEGSTHEARNLSCTTCHSVHKPASFTNQLVKPTETQLCATCHRPQVAKTERAVAHMPVREGKMACSSCHNPHGSISNVKALKAGSSVAELCAAVTPRCADRCSSSTRRCARTARPATIRTDPPTTGCSWSACRCSASAVTSRAGTRRRSTTRTRSPPTRATGCSADRA